MSSISGIGGGNQSLYSFIQSLSGTSASQGATSASSTTASSSDPTQALTQGAQGGHGKHHHGGGGLKQIQDAVTSALQSAQTSGSTTDPNKVIEDAITQVLKNNNSTPSTSTASATATTSPSSGAAPDTDGDSAGAASTSSGATSGATSAQQSFFATLQSMGISPKQFRQDFLAAVKDAQGGQVNPATAFQSVPVGSVVDTIG
jgi:hypothetical protein